MSRKFPVFLDISGKEIKVFGAGRIGARRISSLLDFGPALTVVSPEATQEVAWAAAQGRLVWERRVYEPGELKKELMFVLAATPFEEVDRQIWQECHSKGIPVNVCSDRSLCDFQLHAVQPLVCVPHRRTGRLDG